MCDKKPTGATKKKREQKKNRKDSLSWENVKKELEQASEDEKWAMLETKYRQLYDELFISSEGVQLYKKQSANLEAEKNQLNRELARTVLSKTKMESLARELQKQNKEIKDKYDMKLREEDERRKAMTASFSEKLNKLNSLMDDNRENSVRLKDENLNMRTRLKELYNQFQEREQHVLDMNKQIDLQNQLSQTQLKKLELEFATEKEIWAKEKSILVSRCERLEKTNAFLEENVKSLHQHLDDYQNQFKEFETTIRQSNSMYEIFKKDMFKLQKTNKELSKDRQQWKARSQGQIDTILRMTEAVETLKLENSNIEKKRSALEKLCRQLQAERILYIQKLKDCNLQPPISDSTKETTDSIVPNDTESSDESQEMNPEGVACQTEFPYVVRRLPVRQPAHAPDSRLYFELEEGKLMKFKVDIRCIHNRYLDMLENVITSYSSKTEAQTNETDTEIETMLHRLRNLGPEETDIVLDLGVISDNKIALVANLGMNIGQQNEESQNNTSEEGKPALPKIWIRPLETLLAKPETTETEEK